MPEEQNFTAELPSFYRKLLESQEPLGDEFQKILDDNLHKLLCHDGVDEIGGLRRMKEEERFGIMPCCGAPLLNPIRHSLTCEHNTSSPDCWCSPEIEELDNGDLIVIHRDKSEAN